MGFVGDGGNVNINRTGSGGRIAIAVRRGRRHRQREFFVGIRWRRHPDIPTKFEQPRRDVGFAVDDRDIHLLAGGIGNGNHRAVGNIADGERQGFGVVRQFGGNIQQYGGVLIPGGGADVLIASYLGIQVKGRGVGTSHVINGHRDGAGYGGRIATVQFGRDRRDRQRKVIANTTCGINRKPGQVCLAQGPGVGRRVIGACRQGSALRHATNGDRQCFRSIRIGQPGGNVERNGGRARFGGWCAVGIGIDIKARGIGNTGHVDADGPGHVVAIGPVDRRRDHRKIKIGIGIRRRCDRQAVEFILGQGPGGGAIGLGHRSARRQDRAVRHAADGDGHGFKRIVQLGPDVERNGGIFQAARGALDLIAGDGRVEIQRRRIGDVIDRNFQSAGHRGAVAVVFRRGRGHGQGEIVLGRETVCFQCRKSGKLIRRQVIAAVRVPCSRRQFDTIGNAGDGDGERFGAVRVGQGRINVNGNFGDPGILDRIFAKRQVCRIGDALDVNVNEPEPGLRPVGADFGNRQREINIRIQRRRHGQTGGLIGSQSPGAVIVLSARRQSRPVGNAADEDGVRFGQITERTGNIDGNSGVFLARLVENINRLVNEADNFDTAQGIHIAGNTIDIRHRHRDRAIIGATNGVIAELADDNSRIGAFAADDGIATKAADQQVVAAVADQGVIEGRTKHAFDINQGVAFGITAETGAAGKINDHALQSVGIGGDIEAGAAVQNIGPFTANQNIAAFATEKNVVAGPRIDFVIPGATVNGLTGDVEFTDIHKVIAVCADPVGIGDCLFGLVDQTAIFG